MRPPTSVRYVKKLWEGTIASVALSCFYVDTIGNAFNDVFGRPGHLIE